MIERCPKFDWSDYHCNLPALHPGGCRQMFASPTEIRPALTWIPATCKKCGTRNKFKLPFDVSRVVVCRNCGHPFNLEVAIRG